MGRIPASPFHADVTPRCVRQVGGHVGVDFLLGWSPGSLKDSGSISPSVTWVLLLKNFHFRFLDHLYLRIAIVAQAIAPCNLLLRCRVEVIRHLLHPLLTETSCGPYGCAHACPVKGAP